MERIDKVKINGREKYLKSLPKGVVNSYIKDFVIFEFGRIAQRFTKVYRVSLDTNVPGSFTLRTQDVFEILSRSVDSCFKSFATVLDMHKELGITMNIVMDKFEHYSQLYADALCLKLYEAEKINGCNYDKVLDEFVEFTNECVENARNHLSMIFLSRFERKRNGKRKKKAKPDAGKEHQGTRSAGTEGKTKAQQKTTRNT